MKTYTYSDRNFCVNYKGGTGWYFKPQFGINIIRRESLCDLNQINQIFHYTRCITPKRVTNLRGPSLRHCARATQLLSKKCLNGGEPLAAVSDLTGLTFEPQISRSRYKCVTARPTSRFKILPIRKNRIIYKTSTRSALIKRQAHCTRLCSSTFVFFL